MDNATARVIGAIYLALTNAIDAGSSGAAHDTLIRLADSPDLPAEDRRIYGLIAHSTMLSPEEAERENAELDPQRADQCCASSKAGSPTRQRTSRGLPAWPRTKPLNEISAPTHAARALTGLGGFYGTHE